MTATNERAAAMVADWADAEAQRFNAHGMPAWCRKEAAGIRQDIEFGKIGAQGDAEFMAALAIAFEAEADRREQAERDAAGRMRKLGRFLARR